MADEHASVEQPTRSKDYLESLLQSIGVVKAGLERVSGVAVELHFLRDDMAEDINPDAILEVVYSLDGKDDLKIPMTAGQLIDNKRRQVQLAMDVLEKTVSQMRSHFASFKTSCEIKQPRTPEEMFDRPNKVSELPTTGTDKTEAWDMRDDTKLAVQEAPGQFRIETDEERDQRLHALPDDPAQRKSAVDLDALADAVRGAQPQTPQNGRARLR